MWEGGGCREGEGEDEEGVVLNKEGGYQEELDVCEDILVDQGIINHISSLAMGEASEIS